MEFIKPEVDICILSKASTPALEAVTRKGIETLLTSDDKVHFNIFIVEGNRQVNYHEYPDTHTIYSYLPFGYNKYLNLAIKQGKSPYVFMANNDLTYEKNWASEIILQMERFPDLLSASPFCPQTQRIEDWNISELHYGYGIRRELAGWAIFVQRGIFNIIGKLPEETAFWFSDNDYAMTIYKHGIKHALVTHSIVNHHENNIGPTGNTLSPEEAYRLTMGQQAIFNKKWGIA